MSQNVENKNSAIEFSKNVDKAGMVGGLAIYVAAGIPFALAVAAFSAATFGLTIGGEKLYKWWKNTMKGKKK